MILLAVAVVILAAALVVRTTTAARRTVAAVRADAARSSQVHVATIEALARAIDAKDHRSDLHLRRLQIYAGSLARALGVSPTEIEGIQTAALLHDIGKLAVPEHILAKPGPLTHEEFQKVRIHPEVGAEIVAGVPFPSAVAPIILCHHERWDGHGYPRGLKGDDIPLGARILTVVDFFEAVTTERPYHKALGEESAIGLLQHEAGRALDPHVVSVFIEVVPALRAAIAVEEARTVPAPRALAPSSAPARPATLSNAFENIALAHREVYALYEIAQSMGTALGLLDTMTVLSSKLAKILPWTTLALFLDDAEHDAVTCRFAAGPAATTLLHRVITGGAGLSGWVAHNRRTLIHAELPLPEAELGPYGDELKSAIVCPLLCSDRFVGTLALYHREPARYGENECRLLERIAEQAGAVIHNAIVFEQTQEDSLTDPLTGLPNRRSMVSYLSRELARAERLHSEVALLVLDIDEFKAINDTYGHHVGDQALRAVATAMQTSLRPYDLCVRYAGDEFIIVLSDCTREAAEAKRRELQQRISEIVFEVRPGKPLMLAASAGAAVYPHDADTHEALLADADRRMYRDKASRRSTLTSTSMTPSEVVA